MSSSDTQERASRFLARARDQLEAVNALSVPHSQDECRKLVYFALLDMLSCVPDREYSGNRQRVVGFVREFCDWDHASRVNLPHLYRLTQQCSDGRFGALTSFAEQKMATWTPGTAITLDSDPEYSAVKELWPDDGKCSVPGGAVALEFLQHDQLLYTYRNSIVHELRPPASEMHLFTHEEPVYTWLHMIPDDATSRWVLDYPAAFFHGLVAKGLGGLSTYLEEEHLNPYERFDAGPYWVAELNA